MSTDDANKQNVILRRGPDPRFVWGIVAVVIFGGLLYGSYVKYKELSAELEKTQAKLAQVTQKYKTLESKKTELEQSANEYNAKVEKLTEDNSNLENEISTHKSYPGARCVISVKDGNDNTVEFAFRWCPAGEFMMGSPDTEEGREPDADEPKEEQHLVQIKQGLWMLETEITVGMYKAFVNDTNYDSNGNTPDSTITWRNPGFKQDDQHPVTCVSWKDADEFCKWLSTKTGCKIQLPTEAQWEYACRAGTNGLYGRELSISGWYKENSDDKTHTVGAKLPNNWDLYDMHGNVWEWCYDSSGASSRIYRGGGFKSGKQFCRSACRRDGSEEVLVDGTPTPFKTNDLGFRIVLIP